MLNPWLYHRLEHIFGKVKIANENVPLEYSEYIDPLTNEKRVHIINRGETYCVCCPFCVQVTGGRPDTKFRLWINHLYGAMGHPTGLRFWWLAHCYNEDCLSIPEYKETLKDIVYGVVKPPVFQQTIATTTPQTVNISLPQGVVPIDALAPNHPASLYLAERNFDRRYLFSTFNVCFAASPDPQYPQMHGRIIIPFYMEGRLVGYQGRAINKEDEPKYLTARGTRAGEILYGYDLFPRDSRIAVLVEGPTDVWRLGPGALGLLGTHLSHAKLTYLMKLNLKFLFVVFDSDIATNPHGKDIIRRVAEKLDAVGIRYKVIVLPDERDPSDYRREEFYEFLRRHLS